ncbi:MAG: asparagine synthase (glutamine-hydrolyzing) [Chitinophagales bacterium]
MCGIAGYVSFSAQNQIALLQQALQQMQRRGPDLQRAEQLSAHTAFGHARLSIIDTSGSASQPMTDDSGRYTIAFNGEIFNYRELKAQFLSHKTDFHSTSDTEVLLHLYRQMGANCLQHLNGFFAFAIYDRQERTVFLARDRMGIKPLLVYRDAQQFIFASEMKALLQFPVARQIDHASLALYLQLNYVPGTATMLRNISRLAPGHYQIIGENGAFREERWYQVPFKPEAEVAPTPANYESAKTELRQLVEAAVQRRLVSDVPLGSFLSGGIDSSIVVSQAVKHQPDLHTYSIGFSDEPYFDETFYANLVAKKFNTKHTVFSISKNDMFENLYHILDYLDEPFADSSAIAVYILSQYTRKHVTVALSGDGGDELFGGYNKHQAEWRARENSLVNMAVRAGLPLFRILPKSRHSKFGNLFRQLERYGTGLQLGARDRYWRWCAFIDQQDALALLRSPADANRQEMERRQHEVLQFISGKNMNDVLMADTQMVLPNDMLTKVDLMSMANSLEVRVPLLDYTVVNYAFRLPQQFKIAKGSGKKILKEAFRQELPDELFTRPKRGFEVPLLQWFRTHLRSLITDDLLSDAFIQEQGLFSVEAVAKLKQQLFSNDPGEVHARIWGLLVFQYWYKKWMR